METISCVYSQNIFFLQLNSSEHISLLTTQSVSW